MLTAQERKCDYCGRLYTPKRQSQRFCVGRNCRSKHANRLKEHKMYNEGVQACVRIIERGELILSGDEWEKARTDLLEQFALLKKEVK